MNKTIFLTIFLLFQFFNLQSQESVVCIHGFLRSFRCMIPIGNVARDAGLDVYLWDYPSRSQTIEKHGERLVEVLNAIAQRHPNEPIHFVTHSLGGIIVRAALNHPNCPSEAKMGKAILLAPPNKGAALARKVQRCPIFRRIFGKKAGLQLLTFTEKEMNGIGQFPETKQVMVIAGNRESPFLSKWLKEPNDGKVTVEETKLSTPHHHHTLNVNHSWIMTSKESIELTRSFLFSKEEAEPKAAPTETVNSSDAKAKNKK